jgi:hypothetical protein
LIEDDWPGLQTRHGFDQYNDCSILQMITNRDDNLLAHAVGPLIYNKNSGETDKCATLRRIVNEGPQVAPLVFRYTRYWHGYNPVTAALLQVFDVGDARKALTLGLYGALALLVAAAGTRHPRGQHRCDGRPVLGDTLLRFLLYPRPGRHLPHPRPGLPLPVA